MTKILDIPRNDKIEQLYQKAIALPNDEERLKLLTWIYRNIGRQDMNLIRGAIIDWIKGGRKPGPMPREVIKREGNDAEFRWKKVHESARRRPV